MLATILTSLPAVNDVPASEATLLPVMFRSCPACATTVLPLSVLPLCVVLSRMSCVRVLPCENRPFSCVLLASSRCVTVWPALRLMSCWAMAATWPFSLVTLAARRLRSLPAFSVTLPLLLMLLPASLLVLTLRQASALNCAFSALPVATVPRLMLLPALRLVLPPTPLLTISAPVSVRSCPALATSVPPALLTYRPAMADTLVVLPLALVWVDVVLATFRSCPALTFRLLAASIMPPRLARSLLARTPTLSPEMRPFRFCTFCALMATTLRPAMVPLLVRSPVTVSATLLPPITAPLPSISPCLTRTYTCGTSACVVLPSGKVTVFDTSHTTSDVSCATCASVSATPGVRFHALAMVAPLLSSAWYSA
ncbi:hypothetical protein WG78_15660 [Amantichitinum ursilacus]|uniref:Uncharacterized protein n=1 Tax=Amantichitinum ursilacus TaxID=857265 RepID=A0A0N1JS80_9NEIS|nr:hypothetical protein WG78_15660 [Amantichitinum ursilacus]